VSLVLNRMIDNNVPLQKETVLLVDYLHSVCPLPRARRLTHYNNLYRQLKKPRLLQRMDVLWLPATYNQTAAKVNLVTPGTFTLSEVSSPTWAADQGYTGNGSSSYLNTNFSPSTNAVQGTLNSFSLGAWCLTAGLANADKCIFGYVDTTATRSDMRLRPNNSGHNFALAENNTAFFDSGSPSNGFMVGNRIGASSEEGYFNGASVATASNASTRFSNKTLFLLGLNLNGSLSTPIAAQVGAAYFGSSFSAAEMNTLYLTLQNFLHAVGAV